MSESRLVITVDSRNAENSLTRLRSTLSDVERKGDDASGSMGDFSRESSKTSGVLGKLTGGFNVLGAAIAGAIGGISVGMIIQTADSMTTLSNQIRVATDSAKEYGIAMSAIEDIAMRNNSALDAVGTLYASNERALGQLGKSQQEVLAFTESITRAMNYSGGSAESQAAAITQLGQAMASGALRGDEFNSVAEQAPVIMQLMAKSLGVTTGELRELAANGKITAEAVYSALTSTEAVKSLDEMASKSKTTIKGAFENVKTQFALMVDSIMNAEGGASASIASLIGGFASAMQSIVKFSREYELLPEITTALSMAWGVLKTAIDAVVGAFTAVTNFLAEHKELSIALASGIGAVAAGFVLFKGALIVWTTVATAAAIATTAFGTAMAVLTSPITLVVAAIAGLVAAGVYLYRNWDEIKAKAVDVWQGIADFVTGVFNALPQPIQGAFDRISSIWSGLKVVFGAVGDFLSGAFSAAIDVLAPVAERGFSAVSSVITTYFEVYRATIASAWEVVKQITAAAFDVIVGVISTSLSNAATVFNTVFDAIKTIIKTAFDVIKAIISGDISALKQAISNGVHGISSILQSGFQQIVANFKDLGAKFKQIGSDLIQGLINGIKEKFAPAVEAVQELSGGILNAAKKVLNIQSPSREMQKVGQFVGDGLIKGMKDREKAVAEQAARMAATVGSEISRLQKEIALAGNTSALASLDYDIASGQYAGVDSKQIELLRELTRQKDQESALEESNRYATARQGVAQNFLNAIGVDYSAETALQDRKNAIIEFREWYGMSDAQFNAEMLAAQEQFERDKQSLALGSLGVMLSAASSTWSSMTQLVKEGAGEQSKAYKAMFLVQQAFAMTTATINALQAYNQVLASPWTFDPISKQAAASITLGMGMANVGMIAAQTIAGFKSGGYTGNYGTNQVAGVVHGQEYVLNAQATKRIGRDTLDAVNSGKSSSFGGDVIAPITVHVSVQSNGESSVDSQGQSKQLGQMIGNAVRAVIRQEQRQGGLLSK